MRSALGAALLPGSAAFSGALVRRAGGLSTTDGTPTPVTWNSTEYDVGGWFGASGESQLTVPAGVTRVRLAGGVDYEAGAGDIRALKFQLNGSDVLGGPHQYRPPTAVGFSDRLSIASPVIECVPGDLFRLVAIQQSGGALNVLAQPGTFFAIEAVR